MGVWAVVSTFYKHAEYELDIIEDDIELRIFLLRKLRDYSNGDSEYAESMSLDELIDFVEDAGNTEVEAQRGWGIREVTQIL